MHEFAQTDLIQVQGRRAHKLTRVSYHATGVVDLLQNLLLVEPHWSGSLVHTPILLCMHCIGDDRSTCNEKKCRTLQGRSFKLSMFFEGWISILSSGHCEHQLEQNKSGTFRPKSYRRPYCLACSWQVLKSTVASKLAYPGITGVLWDVPTNNCQDLNSRSRCVYM